MQAAPAATAGAPDARGPTLTFAVEPAALRAAETLPLFGEPPRPLWRRVETTYFDSEAGDLSRNGIALSMRRLRAGFAMGLSEPQGLTSGAAERARSEIKLRSASPILSRFGAQDAERLEALVGEKPLEPLFVAHLRRSLRVVRWGGATIEVRIDAGFLAARASASRCGKSLSLS